MNNFSTFCRLQVGSRFKPIKADSASLSWICKPFTDWYMKSSPACPNLQINSFNKKVISLTQKHNLTKPQEFSISKSLQSAQLYIIVFISYRKTVQGSISYHQCLLNTQQFAHHTVTPQLQELPEREEPNTNRIQQRHMKHLVKI